MILPARPEHPEPRSVWQLFVVGVVQGALVATALVFAVDSLLRILS